MCVLFLFRLLAVIFMLFFFLFHCITNNRRYNICVGKYKLFTFVLYPMYTLDFIKGMELKLCVFQGCRTSFSWVRITILSKEKIHGDGLGSCLMLDFYQPKEYLKLVAIGRWFWTMIQLYWPLMTKSMICLVCSTLLAFTLVLEIVFESCSLFLCDIVKWRDVDVSNIEFCVIDKSVV